MKRRELLALSVSVGAAMAGCLSDDGPANSADPIVKVTSTGYTPQDLSVDVGTTVTWINENKTIVPGHTVTSKRLFEEAAEWDFDEELAEEGDEVSHTFDREGLYSYVGTIKGENCMCGVIEVGDVAYDEPLPCSPIRGGGCQ